MSCLQSVPSNLQARRDKWVFYSKFSDVNDGDIVLPAVSYWLLSIGQTAILVHPFL